MKKKILYFIFLCINILTIITSSAQVKKEETNSKQVLTLFNWGEYLDPQTIVDFEKETNIEVKQILFSSNELAVTKIKSNNQYDLAILSEYAIEQLIQANFLEKIDKSKLETKSDQYYHTYNYFYNEINKNLPKKFDDYAVPYFYGNVVLIYNKKKVSEYEIKNKGFKILKEPNFKVALCNNARDGLMVGLKANNSSIVNPKKEDLEKAKNWLLELKKEKSDLAFINDQLIDRMSKTGHESYDVVVAYSGDANFLTDKNKNLAFTSPIQGTNIWVDGLVMPQGSQKDLAYQFINFLRKKHNYNKNLKYVKYDSPYKDAQNSIKMQKNDEVYQYNVENQKLINTYWNDVIAYPSKKDYWLFGFSGLIVIMMFLKKIKSHTHTKPKKATAKKTNKNY